MRIRTWLLYLVGRRQAILDLAADRRAVGVGALFVLSAGFAREYDGEDLLHEPWYLLIPFAASLVASFAVFFPTFSRTDPPEAGTPAFFTAYRSFLGLFWLTAPLAWFYAVPYERFLAPVQAVNANLLTLAAVSVWRVLLMARVVSVLMGYTFLSALSFVLLVADGLGVAAALALPLPLIDVMGGLRTGLTESERTLRNGALGFLQGGCCFLPVLLLLVLISASIGNAGSWRVALVRPPGPQSTARGLRNLALASVAIWAVILPFTQPEQILRYRVERALWRGHIAEALEVMSAHEPGDFPPLWNPPPRIERRIGFGPPRLSEVVQVMAEQPTTEWVRIVFLRKLQARFRMYDPPEQLKRDAELIERFPEGIAMMDELIREAQRDERAYRLKHNLEEIGKLQRETPAAAPRQPAGP